MRPIREGDRGPAVEDIQRRLLLLGYALGPSGVDGVFAGHTLAAITQFQDDRELNADGLVGEVTWAALVDATFTLGDRALYLRLPHMHGRDVLVLQEALGALGFPCVADGIFGPRTEEAVRDFQLNVALPADGLTGGNTVEALLNLRHLWEGKGQRATISASDRPARGAAILERVAIAVRPDDAAAEELAARIANLALATTEDAQTSLLGRDEEPYEDTEVLLRISGSGTSIALTGVPLVVLAGAEGATLAPRMAAAFIVSEGRCREVMVDVSAVVEGSEPEQQRVAVTLLDALCSALD
jgi:peptidoglycan hydrolase-like protein with peptidoglycan-binding domain